MTSIDALASSGSATAAKRNGPRMRRALLAVPAALALMIPATAFAAETTTGYNQTPPPPTTPKTTPPPPTKHTAPATAIGTPVTIKPSAPAPTTLPFTGLDLRWVIGVGLLMLATGGFSIRVLQRRHQSGGWRSL
jgi:hypothetical protein